MQKERGNMKHKIIVELVNGKKIICNSTEDDYKMKIVELLRMMENYPHNFIDIKQFFNTPNNKSIYLKGEAVCVVRESDEKEALTE